MGYNGLLLRMARPGKCALMHKLGALNCPRIGSNASDLLSNVLRTNIAECYLIAKMDFNFETIVYVRVLGID